MSTPDHLMQPLSGCYFLTRQGALGHYDIQGGFVPNSDMSTQLAGVIKDLIGALQTYPIGSKASIGLVFPASAEQPWNSPTMLFTDEVVETLYPVHGVRTGILTAFQKRNREHSFYRGMELLLGYRRETFPDRPVFAPVFMDRRNTLGTYVGQLSDRPIGPGERDAPVIDVLNLFSQVRSDHPEFPTISALCRQIARHAINIQMRSELNFDIDAKSPRDGIVYPGRPGPHRTSAYQSTNHSQTDPAQGLNMSGERRLRYTPTGGSGPPPNAVNGPRRGVISAPTAARTSGGRIDNPFAQTLNPDLLRRFALFANLDSTRLDQLAAQLSLESASPGSQLIARGSTDPWFYFLVDGIVVLNAGDGTSRRIEAGSEPATQPLSGLLPRKYDVAAMTAIKFIRVDQSTLEQFLAP